MDRYASSTYDQPALSATQDGAKTVSTTLETKRTTNRAPFGDFYWDLNAGYDRLRQRNWSLGGLLLAAIQLHIQNKFQLYFLAMN